MNNEEFLKCRKFSDRLFNEKKELQEKRDNRMLEIETRMSMLEEDEKVREYIELQNEKIKIDNDKFFSRVRDLSDFEIAIKAFDYTCTKTKDSNNIYVFMGYSTDVCSDEEKRIYRNLETLEELKIDFKDELQFIKENKIILSSAKDKEYFFSILRANFFKYLTTNSQEQSVEKILKLAKTKYNSKH